jgi:hypothetical protein
MKTPRTDEASSPYARWTQPPVCGSFARQLELETIELRWLLKNPSRKQRLHRYRRIKKNLSTNLF